MEKETKNEVTKTIKSLPAKDLIRVPHRGNPLLVNLFGPNTYFNNLANMEEEYTHSSDNLKLPCFSFRLANTSESLSAFYGFSNPWNLQILDSGGLQAGRIVNTSKGVFTNTTETDYRVLVGMLEEAKQINGIYLINESIAFVPYDTFNGRTQEARRIC